MSRPLAPRSSALGNRSGERPGDRTGKDARRGAGVGRYSRLVSVTTGGGLPAEVVGTATGIPFGGYAYTAGGTLGPQLGSVPMLIGPAWTFGAYPAWCAARAVIGPGRGVSTVLVACWGLTSWDLTSWDLYLDPQMVAHGKWGWTRRYPAYRKYR